MHVRTTKPHTPWQNKAEILINIIKGKYKRRIVQINIPKKVWEFGMVWETEIYYHTTVKDRCPALEHLTGDTIDISEFL